MIRLIIACERPLTMLGLQQVLGENPEFPIQASTEKQEEILPLCQEWKPDLLLMEVLRGSEEEISTLQEVGSTCPDTGMVIMSSVEEEALFLDLLRTGIVGYIHLKESGEQYPRILREIAGGKKYLSPWVMERVFALLLGYEQIELEPDEIMLVRLLSEGFSSRDIAEELNSESKQIDRSLDLILKKTGCVNRVHLMKWASTRKVI